MFFVMGIRLSLRTFIMFVVIKGQTYLAEFNLKYEAW
jgi:hypothetical protein